MLDFLSEKYREPADCRIYVGQSETEIVNQYPALDEINVEVSRAEAAQAVLTFNGRKDEQGNYSVIDDKDVSIRPWEPIKIMACFGNTEEEVMRGFIREVKVEFPEDHAVLITVTCQDQSLLLDRNHRREVWGTEEQPVNDSYILTEVLSNTGLAPHPDSETGQEGLKLNQDETDIVFLRKRVEAIGYELIFNEQTVYFGPWRINSASQGTINVYAGKDTHCFSFSVNVDGHSPDKVAIQTSQEDGTDVIEHIVESEFDRLGPDKVSSEDSGLEDFIWTMSREESVGEEEMLMQAQKKANELSMKVKAQGELDGTAFGQVLRVAELVTVDGAGETNSGTYYVDSVVHSFTKAGYRQNFSLLRNATGDNVESESGVLSLI